MGLAPWAGPMVWAELAFRNFQGSIPCRLY